jgi:hypothetical protein
MQRRRKRYFATTERKIKELRRQGKHREASDLSHEMSQEEQFWFEAVLALKTEIAINQAERLGVPLPRDREPDHTVWRIAIEDSSRFLTTEALHELNKAIRQERKDRRDIAITLIKDIISPIGALIISILSLLIAYAALKLKH